jgi:hypothetical protein
MTKVARGLYSSLRVQYYQLFDHDSLIGRGRGNECPLFLSSCQKPLAGNRPNLCRPAPRGGQTPDVGSWQDLPFHTSLGYGRNVPNSAYLGGQL